MEKYKYFYHRVIHSDTPEVRHFRIYKNENSSKIGKAALIGDLSVFQTEIVAFIYTVNAHKTFEFELGTIDIENMDTFIPMIEKYIATIFNNKHREVIISTNESELKMSNAAIARIADLLKIKFNFVTLDHSTYKYVVVSRERALSCVTPIHASCEDVEVITKKAQQAIDYVCLRDVFSGLGRNHPVLIKVFKEMGSDAFCNIHCSAKIVEVPKSWKWDFCIDWRGGENPFEYVREHYLTIS